MQNVKCNTCEDYLIVQIMGGRERLSSRLGFDLILGSLAGDPPHVYALLRRSQVCKHFCLETKVVAL